MAAEPKAAAIERIPCPPTPANMISVFIVICSRLIYFFFFLASRAFFWIHTRRGMITDTPL